MTIAPFTSKLLNDFVFLDCRLGSHPKVRTSLFLKQEKSLLLVEQIPQIVRPGQPLPITMKIGKSSGSHLLGGEQYILLNNYEQQTPDVAEGRTRRVNADGTRIIAVPPMTSFLSVPLKDGEATIGVLSIDSFAPKSLNETQLGLAQLLAALLTYSQGYLSSRRPSPATIALGQALRRVREEVGLTQAELAERIARSRIAISRWENGSESPSQGPLYEWCQALGLFSSNERSLVELVDLTPRLLSLLKDDPNLLRNLSPAQFEQFIAERLDRMGFDVTLTGATNRKDGGIDLIAIPKLRTVGSFLIAGQVKHHQGHLKTGRSDVDRLLAWKDSDFRLGLLVTNTSFTKDARWVAEQGNNRPFLRLREFEDLKRWLQDNIWSEEDWLEIPKEITLAPGITVKIPKPQVRNSLEIWPLLKFDPTKPQR